jgi:STE24 endopeptidase
VEVVIAHELGHKVHRDLPKLMFLLGVGFVVALAVGYGVLQTVGRWGGLGGPADVATFPLLALTVAWLFGALQVALNVYSRRIERAADAYALQMTNDPQAFEKVMVLLAQQNKSLPLPPREVEFFFYNHPSIARRVLMARRWQRTAA